MVISVDSTQEGQGHLEIHTGDASKHASHIGLKHPLCCPDGGSPATPPLYS